MAKIKVALLTAGRSDYSIYLPLIKKLYSEKHFILDIIAFGSHPYKQYGRTTKFIKQDGYKIKYEVKALDSDCTEKSISRSVGKTILKFAEIYDTENYELIIAIGDRYEMFAAVAASIPFNIPVAHIHGGETTLGAIDEKFRHSISIMAKYHFASTKKHAQRITQIIGHTENIFTVGALALDNIRDLRFMSISKLKQELGVDFGKPTLLATLHPETVEIKANKKIVTEFNKALSNIKYQVVVTLPNNDTRNKLIRERLVKLCKVKKNVFAFDALGPEKYYSCMKYCYAVIGNSSSGIIEAASFGKYVINIGERQKGRDRGKNIIDVLPESTMIVEAINKVKSLPHISNYNIYGEGKTAKKIVNVLKNKFVK